MQQYCTYGSVRGAPGDRRSYRDKRFLEVSSDIAIVGCDMSTGADITD